jgi:hypothetical protein
VVERAVRDAPLVGGRISPVQVRSIAKATGASEDEVRKAVAALGGKVEPVPRIPRVPAGLNMPEVERALRVLGVPHVADFLLGGHKGPFFVVDGLRYLEGAFRINWYGPEQLRDLRATWASRPPGSKRSAAKWLIDAMEALHASDEMGMRHLALAQLAGILRGRLAAGIRPADLPAEAQKLGVDPGEAAILGFMVAETGSAAARVYMRLSDALDRGRLHEAEQRIAKLPRDLTEPDLLDVTARIRDAVEAAKGHLRAGRAAESKGDVESAAGEYLRAADFVSDHPKLAAALARCAPAPPPDVEAAETDGSVALSWPASPARAGSIDYRVVCRIGEAPRGPDDGRVVFEGAHRRATDDAAPAGRLLYYGVFTRRNETWWSPTAARSGAVVPAPPVSDLSHTMRNCAVHIRWKPPAVGHVTVTRTEKAGSGGSGEGVEVAERRPGRIHDVGLTLGTEYRYRVVTVFEPAPGRSVASRAHVITVTADVDPVAVDDLVVTLDRERSFARLQWGGGSNGSVKFIESTKKLPRTAGTLLSLADVATLGAFAHEAPDGADSMRIPLLGGPRFLTPVTVRGGQAAIGKSELLAIQAPVAGLSLRRFRDEVRALWEWPDRCSEVIVAIRPDLVPFDDDPEATTVRVSRSEYESNGGCLLRLPDGIHGISVTAIGTFEGERLLSPPRTGIVGPLGAGGAVRYEVIKPGRFSGSRRILRITTDDQVPPIDFVLRARPGRIRPMEPTDPQGVDVVRIDGLTLKPGVAVEQPVDLGHLPRPSYLRGFVVGEATEAVELRDPYREELVIT